MPVTSTFPVSVALVDAHEAGTRDYSAPLWSLLMFQAFLGNAGVQQSEAVSRAASQLAVPAAVRSDSAVAIATEAMRQVSRSRPVAFPARPVLDLSSPHSALPVRDRLSKPASLMVRALAANLAAESPVRRSALRRRLRPARSAQQARVFSATAQRA